METIKFYCQNKPKVGETVQVIFTERKDDHTEGYLTEYDGNIIMVHAQATKKKKIKSYNKIIPLNKSLPAVIEDFDELRNLGSVSRAYLDLPEEEYSKKFSSNNKMYNGINQLCSKLELNFDEIWKNKLFPYFYEKFSSDDKSYLEKFMQDLNIPDDVLENNELRDMIIERFSNFSIKKEVFKKEIGIVSNNGIISTKKVIEDTLNETEKSEEFLIKYRNAPNYMIETEISQLAIDNFIGMIQEKAKEVDGVFVKLY